MDSSSMEQCTVIVPSEDETLRNNHVLRFQRDTKEWIQQHRTALKRLLITFALIGYFVYLGFAIRFSYEGSLTLIVYTSIAVILILYNIVRDTFGGVISRTIIRPITKTCDKLWRIVKWLFYPAAIIGVILYFTFSVIKSASQLRALITLAILLAIPVITCKYPNNIKWRPVLWGLSLQLLFGIMVLRWKPGYDAMKFVSEELNKFLMYSLEGSAVVFGDPSLFLHPFVGIVLPLVIYIGAVLGLFYYIGLTQLILTKFGWLMSKTFQTTGVESVSLVANLFFSVVEIILIIKPYTTRLTKSEFHTVLVGSHASIAGFAYAIFVWFGVNPQHLLTAAVMSAPAAVAISKLNFPETEESYYRDESVVQFEKSTETNVFEAVSNGAKQAGKSVAALILMVIAFISLYYFIDTTIAWLGSRCGLETSLSTIFSYVFRPLAYMIGVDWEECDTVGTVMGIKLLPNEMLAYLELGALRVKGELSERSSALTTYAICGFSSVGTLMMFIGVWRTVNSGSETTRVATAVPRVYMNTNIACLITACVAGMLYDEEIISRIDSNPPPTWSLATLLDALPSYKTIMNILPGYNF